MRKLLAMLLFVSSCYAQPVLDNIVDTIYDQTGALYNGSLQYSLSANSATSNSTVVILSVPKNIQISAGQLNINLVPNDTMQPANMAYILQFGAGARKICTFPTLSGAVALGPYCSNTPPANPVPGIPVSWINPCPAGKVVGTALGGSSTSCVTVSGGGGGTPCVNVVAFSSTPVFDFSLCTQQKITLTGNIIPSFLNIGFCEVTGGCTITFIQGSGNYNVTWPGNVHGGFQLGATSARLNVQAFTSYDGNNLSSITPGIVNQ